MSQEIIRSSPAYEQPQVFTEQKLLSLSLSGAYRKLPQGRGPDGSNGHLGEAHYMVLLWEANSLWLNSDCATRNPQLTNPTPEIWEIYFRETKLQTAWFI